mmetsp:Transcript_1653/g.3647  ORF Transcript_1653/g.3647 Transcript_1653/m.3647 type:complete len:413 (-) Transcript_1653:2110-3348(-)
MVTTRARNARPGRCRARGYVASSTGAFRRRPADGNATVAPRRIPRRCRSGIAFLATRVHARQPEAEAQNRGGRGRYRYRKGREDAADITGGDGDTTTGNAKHWREEVLTDGKARQEGGDAVDSGWSTEPGPASQSVREDFGGWFSGNPVTEPNWGGESPSDQQQQAQGEDRSWFGESFGRSNRDAGDETLGKLDLHVLSQEDFQAIIPLSGTSNQYAYYWGTWDQAVQRISFSLLVSLLAANSNSVLAAGAFSYCICGPIVQSVLRNFSAKKYSHAGFWTASVLDLSFQYPEQPRRAQYGRRRRGGADYRGNPEPDTTTVIRIGEDRVADVEIQIPYSQSHELIRLGDPALLMVVSNSPSLRCFKAVRDVYLPATREWFCEYPFVSRPAFRAIANKVAFRKKNSNNNQTQWR